MNEANYYLGLLCDRTDRADEALAWYRKAAETAPENPVFTSTFALALERKSRYPEALLWYRRAAEAAPSDPVPHFGAGAVLTRLKRWKEAEDSLEIQPRPLRSGVTIETYHDHRFAMSFGILGCHDLHGDGRPWLTVNDPSCCTKTFPAFFDLLAALRAGSH